MATIYITPTGNSKIDNQTMKTAINAAGRSDKICLKACNAAGKLTAWNFAKTLSTLQLIYINVLKYKNKIKPQRYVAKYRYITYDQKGTEISRYSLRPTEIQEEWYIKE
jgi:hypothetical protein